ncbi:MAG: helicase RepA family protein [Actinomycetota bacterium]|nr:helicase RepA family protein [Actinomycetota bacterium]
MSVLEQVGPLVPRLPPHLLPRPRSRPVGSVQVEAAPAHSLLAGLRNGAWLDAQEFAPLRYTVPELIPEGLSLFVGPPKVGKSWALLGVALGVAVGGVAFGRLKVGAARPVLMLALEDGDRRLQDRSRRLLDGEPIPERFDYITRLIRPGTVLDTIAAWLEDHGDDCPLVVLDTLGKVMPPALVGESAYQRDYRIGSALKRVADDYPGTSLVVNHHDRKAGSDDFVDAVSGTHGLAGAADTVMVLSRNRHETDAVLRVTGRDVPEGEYALRVVDGAFWQIDGDSLEAASRRAVLLRSASGLSDRSLDVIAFVNERPEGVTPKAVADALGLDDARQYLRRLANEQRIAKPKRGLYTPVTTVTTSQPLGHGDTSDIPTDGEEE